MNDAVDALFRRLFGLLVFLVAALCLQSFTIAVLVATRQVAPPTRCDCRPTPSGPLLPADEPPPPLSPVPARPGSPNGSTGDTSPEP